LGSPPASPRSSARGFPLAVASCRRAALRCSLAVGSRSLLLASALAPLLARSSLRCSLAVGSRCSPGQPVLGGPDQPVLQLPGVPPADRQLPVRDPHHVPALGQPQLADQPQRDQV